MSIVLRIEAAGWRRWRGLGTRLKRAAGAALSQCGTDGRATVLLTADGRLQELNLAFRGKDMPTNVLSFPAAANAENYLGDVALAYGVTVREAKAAGKTLSDHACHLVVHGILHLLGFDHRTAPQARKMEPLEIRILAGLGIENPYDSARAT